MHRRSPPGRTEPARRLDTPEPPLTEALRQTGYYTKQRLFTSRQVALIFEYLGEP